MSKPLVGNAADEGQVRLAGHKEKRKRDREQDDVRAIMSTDYGRRFIWRLLERAGIFRSSFTGNSTTFFNEGMRNIGLMHLAEINEACPELYLKMLNEAKEDPNV